MCVCGVRGVRGVCVCLYICLYICLCVCVCVCVCVCMVGSLPGSVRDDDFSARVGSVAEGGVRQGEHAGESRGAVGGGGVGGHRIGVGGKDSWVSVAPD